MRVDVSSRATALFGSQLDELVGCLFYFERSRGSWQGG